MMLLPREMEKLGLHQAGFLAQKRLARGIRLNYTEAVALIATQVEGTFHDGPKLLTVDKPICSENGNLELALHGSSFLPVSRLSKKPATKVSSFGRKFHSCGRGALRFSSLVRVSVLKKKKKAKLRDCSGNAEISGGEVSFRGLEFDAEKPTSKEKEVVQLSDEEGDSITKDSSFKEVKVGENKVEVCCTTWGLRNDENGINSRLSLLDRSPRKVKKQKPRVGENLVKQESTSWGLRNDKNGINSRLVLRRRSRRLAKKHVEVSNETFLPLTKDEEAKVRRTLSGRDRTKVLASHENSNIDITGETLQCLKPGAWLNDEVINLYLALLKERETREPHKYLKCHFCSTFFYKKLAAGRSGYNYAAVKRWTTQRKLGYNLTDCDIIFVPIHGRLHWTLAVINIRESKFQYLDSLQGFDPTIFKSLAKYLVDEVKDKSQKNIDVSLWATERVKDLPLQQNGYDCGMFMLKYIDFYSRGLKLSFSQKDMAYFRLRTAKEILSLRAD